MKKNIIIMASHLVFFALMTLVFLMAYGQQIPDFGFVDGLLAVLYGLPHSLCVVAWVMTPSVVASLLYCWLRGPWLRRFMLWYHPLVVLPILFFYVLDLVLYGFWGFRLDATPLVYILDNPMEALGESPWWAPVVSILAMSMAFFAVRFGIGQLYPARRSGSITRMPSGKELEREAGMLLATTVVLLVVAGGCFGAISMGSAYHSTRMPLNHASTHPVYSFFHSLDKQGQPFDRLYRFMDKEQAETLMSRLDNPDYDVTLGTAPDLMPADTLLRTRRPNILLVLLESFSGVASSYLYPEADPEVMPCLNAAMAEGVAFRHFYANSFRTERGLAAILAACPGQPIHTVMTDTTRAAALPQLARTLVEDAGYTARFFTGGDKQFCGLQPFLRSGGYSEIIGRDDFPADQHNGPWGLHDEQAYQTLAHNLEFEVLRQQNDTTGTSSPFFSVCMSVSSHEPFEVPFQRFDDPYLNSVAYADSCLGLLLDALRASVVWQDLLVIAMPDHGYAQYPEGVQQHDPLRYHIPMVWTGGAVADTQDAQGCRTTHRDIDQLGQQTDLAATLLHQLGLSAGSFRFSHDMLVPQAPHFAFYAWPDGYGILTDTGAYAQDNNYTGHNLLSPADFPLASAEDSTLTVSPADDVQQLGEAYLQTLYDYLHNLGQ